jgi:hypothetical protein
MSLTHHSIDFLSASGYYVPMIAKTIAKIKKKIWEMRGKKIGDDLAHTLEYKVLHPLGVQWGFPYIFSNTPGCWSSSSSPEYVEKDLWETIRISFPEGRMAHTNRNAIWVSMGGNPRMTTLIEGPPNRLVSEWGF